MEVGLRCRAQEATRGSKQTVGLWLGRFSKKQKRTLTRVASGRCEALVFSSEEADYGQRAAAILELLALPWQLPAPIASLR